MPNTPPARFRRRRVARADGAHSVKRNTCWELDEERDTTSAQLNSLLGRSPDEPIEIAGSYRNTPALPSVDELERVAIEHRPELASLRK